MRRNRKMPKKYSVVAGRTMQLAAVLVMAFAMAILNRLASSSCKQLTATIREKERQLARLEDEKSRESARWEAMKTSDKLEAALLRNGLKMDYADPVTQVVRLRKDGRPYEGQKSVARAAQRNRTMAASASYRPSARPSARSVPANRVRR